MCAATEMLPLLLPALHPLLLALLSPQLAHH
jgi:hypothetical protein